MKGCEKERRRCEDEVETQFTKDEKNWNDVVADGVDEDYGSPKPVAKQNMNLRGADLDRNQWGCRRELS